MGIVCIAGFGPLILEWVEEIVYRVRSRRRKSGTDDLERLARHQRTLKRIDELERELEIGKYSPAAKELDARMAAEAKAEEMARRAGWHAELVEKLRARGEDFPITEATRILGWFSDGRIDSTARPPLRRIVDEETGEVSEIRAFGT